MGLTESPGTRFYLLDMPKRFRSGSAMTLFVSLSLGWSAHRHCPCTSLQRSHCTAAEATLAWNVCSGTAFHIGVGASTVLGFRMKQFSSPLSSTVGDEL